MSQSRQFVAPGPDAIISLGDMRYVAFRWQLPSRATASDHQVFRVVQRFSLTTRRGEQLNVTPAVNHRTKIAGMLPLAEYYNFYCAVDGAGLGEVYLKYEPRPLGVHAARTQRIGAERAERDERLAARVAAEKRQAAEAEQQSRPVPVTAKSGPSAWSNGSSRSVATA